MAITRLKRRTGKGRKIKRRIAEYHGFSHERFTRRTRYIVLRALEERLPLDRAAELAGMTGKMLTVWLKRGLSDDPMLPHKELYASFRRRVIKIRSRHEKDALIRIEAAARGGRKVTEIKIRVKSLGPIQEKEITKVVKHESPKWGADAWWLERARRKEYGREVLGEGGGGTPEEDAAAIKQAADVLFDSVPIRDEGGGDRGQEEQGKDEDKESACSASIKAGGRR